MHCRGSSAGRSVVIGLDTNVHVRHLAQDDPKQSVVATRFIEALTSG
jgi:predicted nucleic-acid-binding protein